MNNTQGSTTSVSYTNRDIQQIRKYLVNLVHQLTDDWTDFNESDVGMVLIELMAGYADMMGFYLDKQALECYIDSVKQRKNGMSILQLVNYRLHMMNSAVTTGRFTLDQAYDRRILIPRYTQVSASLGATEKIYYATDVDTYILPGEITKDITLRQGVVTESYISVADMMNSQKITILADNVAADSVSMELNGEQWEYVEDVLLDEQPGPKFSVFEDKNCRAYLLFHNTYKDYLPTDTTLRAKITYLVTLGKEGSVAAGAISKIEDPIYDGQSNIADRIEITNVDQASGGSDRETLDEARIQAPKTFAMLGKAIILEDFKTMADGLPGVLVSQAVDWSIEDSKWVSAPYQVNLYIVPEEGTECSDAQLREIEDYFNNADNRRTLASVSTTVMTAVYKDVDIIGTVYARVSEDELVSLKTEIEEALKEEYAPQNLSFGTAINPSNVYSFIESLNDKISYCELSSPSVGNNLEYVEFPRLNTVDITVKRLSSFDSLSNN